MILYNVTIKIELAVHDEWLAWMKNTHIPDVMNTGLFLENRICRLLSQDESEGITYAIQYWCESMQVLHQYYAHHAPALQAAHTAKYRGRFVAFRTLMETV